MQSFVIYLLTPCPKNPGFLEGKTVTILATDAAEAVAIAKRQYPNSIIGVEE